MPINKAAWLEAPFQKPVVVKESPYPAISPGHVVIKVAATAINPADVFAQENDTLQYKYPSTFGFDVAGEVVEVGEDVTHLKNGQRVLAWSQAAGDSLTGAFQLYTKAPVTTTSFIPDNISYEQATVIPVTLATAAAALYEKSELGLPLPSDNPQPSGTLLIWSGSTSVGCNAIQLARASGYEVVTTASPHNHALCKTLGAAAVFDHHDPNVVNDIVNYLKEKKLAGIFDTISNGKTLDLCRAIAKAQQLKVVNGVMPLNIGEKDGISYTSCMAWTIRGNEIGRTIFKEFLPKALASGKFLPKPDPTIVGSGLESIQVALDKYSSGMKSSGTLGVSAGKYVVTLP